MENTRALCPTIFGRWWLGVPRLLQIPSTSTLSHLLGISLPTNNFLAILLQNFLYFPLAVNGWWGCALCVVNFLVIVLIFRLIWWRGCSSSHHGGLSQSFGIGALYGRGFLCSIGDGGVRGGGWGFSV